MPNRSATHAKSGRGARFLITTLACGVGCLAAWVLAANTIFRPTNPGQDVAAALLAARDGGAPTLSILKVASVAVVPDVPPPSAPAAPEPASPPPVTTTTIEEQAAAPEPAPAIVLASAGSNDYTGALAAPAPVEMPDVAEDEATEGPLTGLVPLPRKRPSDAALIPLPRPRPEIETVASAAPVMSLTPYEIEKHQPQ